MTFLTKVGSFSTGTPAGGGTITLSGVGFTPQVLILWWSGRTESVDTVGRGLMNRGMGWAISASSYCGVNTWSRDNNTTSLCNREQGYRVNPNDVGVLMFRTATNAVDGQAILQTMNADGAVFDVTDAFGTSYRINYLALGGTDLSNYEIGKFTKNLASGNQTVTLAGSFEPDLVLLLSTFQTTINAASLSDSCWTFGAFDGTAQGVWLGGGNNTAADGQTLSYCNDAECLAMFESTVTSISNRAAYVSKTTGSFTINWIEADGTGSIIFYLALKGLMAKVAPFTTQTDTSTPIVVSTPGMQPATGLLVSHCKAESAADTPSDHDKLSLGAFTSTTEREALATSDQDAAAVMRVSEAVEYDEVYANIDEATSTIQGLMDVTAISIGSVSFIMDDADPVAAFGWGIFMASSTPPAGAASIAPTATGGWPPKFTVLITDAFGNILLNPLDWQSFTYVRAENEISPLTLILPGYYNDSYFQRDYHIEIWKEFGGRPAYLDTETAWLIRLPSWKQGERGLMGTWEIQAFCYNDLLRRRIVDYNEQNAYTSKLDEADDLGKAVVRENFGSLAADATRQWATSIFTVQADLALAPILRKSFANATVWRVLQELAEASYQKGTYLVFDTVWNSGVPELRAYINQRGNDHRNPGGNPPLNFGPDFGNLTNVELSWDWTEETTRVIVGGESIGTIMAKARANDTARQGASPYNFIETFEHASDEVDATGLLDLAGQVLRDGIPKVRLNGKITPTEGFLRGLHWDWGDRLTAQARGYSFDCRITKIQVTVDREGGEQSEGAVIGEVV